MSYSNIKKSNEENFDLLVQCICSYREEDDIIYFANESLHKVFFFHFRVAYNVTQ